MMVLKFNSPVEAMMYSLYTAMGSTFGIYSTPDQVFPPTIWRASPDKEFSNIRDVDIVIDTHYTAGSIASVKKFESDWLSFINDPHGRGRASLAAWFYDEAEDVLYLGFSQDGVDDHVDPNDQSTWYGEWGYAPDPPIWLRVKIAPRDLDNFVQLHARYFWSTRYQLQK